MARKLELIDTVILPCWALCPLINADCSGITEEEIRQIVHFEDKYSEFGPVTYHPQGEEAFFSWHNAIDNLGADCFTVDIVGYIPADR